MRMPLLAAIVISGSCLVAQAADPTVKKAVKLHEQATGNLILTIDAAKPVNEQNPQTFTIKAADPAAKSSGKQDARITGTVTVTTDAVKPAKEQTPQTGAKQLLRGVSRGEKCQWHISRFLC
jgi:hypothetical protein